MILRTIVPVLLFCFALVATANGDDFRTAVESGGKKFMETIAAKDAAGLGSLYATDATAFPPNHTMINGRDAIQAFWKGFMDAGMTAKIEIVETQSEGTFGFEVGKYTIHDPSGATVDNGKYLVVWKKGKEGWQLYRDMWNSSMPPPAPATK